jgi:tetratricopeptide (TPR) repeat protein
VAERQRIADRYEIVGTVGHGGMGDVYRGLDEQTGETVAIKLLKPDIVDAMPNLIERFEREGEALRRLNHPNIVKMLAAVEEDGLYYLVMEYVPGGSLRDLLENQPQLPIPRVLEIALDLADALTRAHRLQIIHRDLKPANVLLAEDGTPRLTDFGVARLGSETRMTETGAVIGTYAYLSPEACRSSDIDTRTDIWAFGVLLYEMLAGQHPFQREHGPATLISILNDPVPDLTALRPDVPPALVALIDRMLQKDRDERIPSVRQVGAELEAIIYGLDTPLRPAITPALGPDAGRSRFATETPPEVPPPYTTPAAPEPVTQTAAGAGAPPDSRRMVSRTWIVLADVVVLALVVALVGALAFAFGIVGGDDDSGGGSAASGPVMVEPVGPGEYMVLVSELEALDDDDDHDMTRFVRDDLIARLEDEVPFSNLRVRAYPQVITSGEAALAAAEANNAPVVVWGNYTGGQVEVTVQIGTLAPFSYIGIDREMLERTVNVRAVMTDPRHQSVASSVLAVMNVLQTADGRGYEVARTVAILGALELDHAETISGGVGAALQTAITYYLDDTPRAIEGYDQGIALQPDNPLLYTFRGAGYVRLGEFDRALRDFETAERLGPPDWATPAYTLGLLASSTGDIDAAIAYLSEVVALRPDDWFAWNYRGALYYLQGDREQAQQDVDRALALGPDTNFAYITGLVLALREGQIFTAHELMQEILTRFPDPTYSSRLFEALYGDRVDNLFAAVYSAVGNLILGRYEEVLRSADAALAIDDSMADVYLLQGLAYCSLDDNEASEAALTQAIEYDPDFAEAYALRAQVRMALGDRGGMLDDLRIVSEYDLGPEFEAMVQAGVAGDLNCKTFFTYDYSELMEVMGETGEDMGTLEATAAGVDDE